MKKKKTAKILSLILCAVLALSVLASCNSQSGVPSGNIGTADSENTQSDATKATPEPQIQLNPTPEPEANAFEGKNYDELKGEDWDSKTIVHQFLSDYEDGSNYRICANLYSDGSVASWQGVTLNSDDGDWIDEALHIRWDFFGYWTKTEENGVTTLSIHITKNNDENGNAEYLDYECSDELETGVFELPEYACFSFGKVFNDGKGADTKRAVSCDGTVHYNTVADFCNSWLRDDFASA